MDKLSTEVYKAIDTERQYQDKLTADQAHPEMIDIGMGDSLAAIHHNLNKALETWYREAVPYPMTMVYLRKIAAISVRCGEKFGMPYRNLRNYADVFKH